MATPSSQEAVQSVLSKNSIDLDESIMEYLVSMVDDQATGYGEPGNKDERVSELQDAIGPFLEDFGCDEDKIKQICLEVVTQLGGAVEETEEEANGDEGNEVLNQVSVFRPVVLAEVAAEEAEKIRKEYADAYGTVGEQLDKQFNKMKVSGAVEMDNRTRNRILKKEKKAEERLAREQANEELLKLASQVEVVVVHRNPEEQMKWNGDIHLDNVHVSVGGKTLVDDSQIFLQKGRRFGLVGRNGTGKTTFLRHFSSRELRGIPEGAQILHVEQEIRGSEQTVLEAILSTDRERSELLREEKELTEGTKEEEEGRLAQIYTRLNEIDAYSAEARAAALLSGLGFSLEMQQMATKQFSGGWRMRVALAQALYVTPDVLLLDEPTNHLDLPACLWLENYLQKSTDLTLLLVSHDRQFLNNVATDVIHLHDRRLTQYKGDYDSFEDQRAARLKTQQAQYESSQAKRKHMKEFIDKFRFNAKRASLVQSRVKALERMEKVAEVISDPDIVFNFPTPEKLNPPMLHATKIAFGYTRERILFSDVSFSVTMDTRVCIVGPNGAGKSTLVKLLTEELVPLDGYVHRSNKLRLALFSQHHSEQLDGNLNPIDQLIRKYPAAKVADARSHLGQFGVIGDMQMQSIRTLSGGQKSRVALAVLCYSQPHVLLLDEPTNHLDIDTVGALIHALNVFKGGVIVVSHDQHLIHGFADEMWIVGGGKVVSFRGDFEEYKAKYVPKNE